MNTESVASKNGLATNQRPDQENVAWIPPRVDIYENQEEFLVVVDVPGVGLEGVQLETHKGELTIEARSDQGRNYRRAFSVPDAVRVDGIRAELRNGVLQVHLPKAPEEKPRKIRVEAPN